MNDADKIALLLTSRNDWLPTPKGNQQHLDAAPGPQPSRYVPCEPCSGSGRQKGVQACIVCRDATRARTKRHRPNHGCRPCPNCDGTGERRARRGDQPYERYSGLPIADLQRETNEAHEHTARRIVLAAEERPEGETALERLRRSYYQAGSYAELDRALARLEARNPDRHSQLIRWADLGGDQADQAFGWTPEAGMRIVGTLWLLAAWMPRPIRVPTWVRRAARNQPKDVIRIVATGEELKVS